MKPLQFFLFGLLLTTLSSIGQTNLLGSVLNIDQFEEITTQDDWEAYKNKKGVNLKYRWLKLADDSKTRQLKISFQSDKSADELLRLIKHSDFISKWNSSVREQNLLDDIDSTWVSHTVFAIPYPLNQQDLVVKNKVIKKSDEVVIDAYSIPNHIQELKNTKRLQFYLSQWRFLNSKEGITDVEFSLVSMSKSAIPRWIRDPIVLNRLINSFIELKNFNENSY